MSSEAEFRNMLAEEQGEVLKEFDNGCGEPWVVFVLPNKIGILLAGSETNWEVLRYFEGLLPLDAEAFMINQEESEGIMEAIARLLEVRNIRIIDPDPPSPN